MDQDDVFILYRDLLKIGLRYKWINNTLMYCRPKYSEDYYKSRYNSPGFHSVSKYFIKDERNANG